MPRKPYFDIDVWIERWRVLGTSGIEYTVAKNRDGSYGCNCNAWMMQRKEKWSINPDSGKLGRVDCQHILKKKMELLQAGQIKVPQTPKKWEDPEVERDIDLS